MVQRNTKITLEEFIQRAEAIHGKDTYNYSKVTYKNRQTKVEIICPTHGSFFQTPSSHIGMGCGCRKCAEETRGRLCRDTNKEFVEKAQKVHGKDRYNYSETDYKISSSKVRILCNKCGNKFSQKASDHLSGCGCPICGREVVRLARLKDREWFICKSKEIHGDKYDYSAVKYVNVNTKVKIYCNSCNNYFYQLVTNHIYNKQGCSLCSKNKKITKDAFIMESSLLHNYKYQYDLVDNISNNRTKVKIICPTHGIFEQQVASHLRGHGCDLCARDYFGYSNRKNITKPAILYYIKIEKDNKNYRLSYVLKPAILYYIKIEKDNKNYYKIGVTTTTVARRFKSEVQAGAKITSLKEDFFDLGGEAYKAEKRLLRTYALNRTKDSPLIYGGNSEVFDTDVLNLDKRR